MKQLLLVCGLLTSVVSAAFAADAPNLLNYQGKLTDSGGSPKNGTFSMQFSVYDAVTGGNQLPNGTPWSETQSVTVTNGVFNVLLGSVTALPSNLFTGGPSDTVGPLRFLQVSVGGETLVPRNRIASAAYSIEQPVSSSKHIFVGSANDGLIATLGSGQINRRAFMTEITGVNGTALSMRFDTNNTNDIGGLITWDNDFDVIVYARFATVAASGLGGITSRVFLGLSSSPTPSTASTVTANHIGFEAIENSGVQFYATNGDGNAETLTTIATTNTGTWYTFRFTKRSTIVSYYVDDVLVASHATNVPSGGVAAYLTFGGIRGGTSGSSDLAIANSYTFIANP